MLHVQDPNFTRIIQCFLLYWMETWEVKCTILSRSPAAPRVRRYRGALEYLPCWEQFCVPDQSLFLDLFRFRDLLRFLDLLRFPDHDQAMEKIRDLTCLSDILPTGYHGAVMAGVKPGSTVYVAGAGPVGLAAAVVKALSGR